MDNKRKTIFLVDDEVTNLAIGKNALSGTYNVFTLNSGKVFLSLLDDLVPDLVLLDIKMPEMDGFEVIKRIKASERTKNIPVILLTALDDEEAELKGLSLGAVDFIPKPFSPALLLKHIEIHLLMEAQKQELEAQKKELQGFNENLFHMVADKTKSVVELKNALISTMAELVEHRDGITGGHIERTQNYIKILMTAIIAEGLYPEDTQGLDMEMLLQSSQLHDVGKIAISDSVLFKQDKLTPEEFDEMKKHTTYGEKVILGLKSKTLDTDFLEYARVFAVTHP